MNQKVKKILIIEDDKNYLFLLKTNFIREGFVVVTAEKGGEGIDLALKEKPDLAIIDLLLPDVYGLQVARKIREAGVKIPLFFLTNVKDEDEISKALETEDADYLIKSDINLETIVSLVKNRLKIV